MADRAAATRLASSAPLRDTSFGALFKSLVSDMGILARQEFRLLEYKLAQRGRKVSEIAGLLGAAALLTFGALMLITTLLILLLQPLWGWIGAVLAAAIVWSIAAITVGVRARALMK